MEQNMEELLVTFIDPYNDEQEQEEAFSNILELISDKNTSSEMNFEELIPLMDNHLTNEDSKFRERGTELLSRLLGRSDEVKLKGTSIFHFTKFFCDRLSDFPSLLPSLKALLSLLRQLLDHDQGYEEVVECIITSLFTSIHIPQIAQKSREAALSLLAGCYFLSQFTNQLTKHCLDFLCDTRNDGA